MFQVFVASIWIRCLPRYRLYISLVCIYTVLHTNSTHICNARTCIPHIISRAHMHSICAHALHTSSALHQPHPSIPIIFHAFYGVLCNTFLLCPQMEYKLGVIIHTYVHTRAQAHNIYLHIYIHTPGIITHATYISKLHRLAMDWKFTTHDFKQYHFWKVVTKFAI